MSNKLEEARKIINEVDSRMAQLFVKRMGAAEMVYEYKKEHGLPILDPEREEQVILSNSALIEDENLRSYYIDFITNIMRISRQYQHSMQESQKLSDSFEPHTEI